MNAHLFFLSTYVTKETKSDIAMHIIKMSLSKFCKIFFTKRQKFLKILFNEQNHDGLCCGKIRAILKPTYNAAATEWA